MNLPQDGRVVVIDDIAEQAIPLLLALSKNGIPAAYFTGQKHNLPKVPLVGVRMVFLDIVLEPSVLNDKTKVAMAAQVLSKIISKDNGPYIVMAWTGHPELLDRMRQHLDSNPPLALLALEKAECKTRKGAYSIRKIEMRVKQALKRAGAFHLFVIWQNLVSRSCGDIVNTFASFYAQDSAWNTNMCSLFLHLARAYAGQTLRPADLSEVARKSLLAFNGTFLDTLEARISTLTRSEITAEFESGGSVDDVVKASINSSLLLVLDGFDQTVTPCAVFENRSNKVKLAELFDGCLQSYRDRLRLVRNVRHVLLEVSPVCDYVQKKLRMHRLLPGVLWPVAHEKKIKRKTKFIYESPLFHINKRLYRLVFDLRHLTSLRAAQLKNTKVLFKVRNELLAEIQYQLSGHINRPGLVFLP